MRCGPNDLSRVLKVLCHEDISYFFGKDEETLPLFIERLLGNESIYVLMPNNEGVFLFIPHGSIAYEGHGYVLPEGRGKSAFMTCSKTIEYMFSNTNCLKIIGFVPVFSRKATRFYDFMGFYREGLSTESCMKNGKLHHQIIYGMTKKQWENRGLLWAS